MLPHEKLDVYRKALDFIGHARAGVVLCILLNIAEGNGRYSEVDHRRFLDLPAAAAVKVAAGLDLATRKGLWDRTVCEPGKALLERIMAMLSRM